MDMANNTTTRAVPAVILERRIGGTLFIVSARFRENATENISDKMRRLILEIFLENRNNLA